MAKRRMMSRRESNRNFRKGGRVNARNFATVMRGGYRI